MSKNILCSISTKGRYDTTLPLAIMSVLMQTKLPDSLFIFDDNENPIDLRTIQIYEYLLKTLDEKGVVWKIIFGQKKGQHYNHELANKMGFKWVWRIDDDCIAEANVLQSLYEATRDNVGAVGGSILTPPFHKGVFGTGKIENVKTESNIQWDYIKNIKEVDHLHCSYLYRAGIEDFCTELSSVAHREETLHTYGIKKKGYKLLLVPCVTWHYKNRDGGIRSHNNHNLYDHDEKIFDRKLNGWDIISDSKLIVLDNGIGDHYAFKNILPKLRQQCKHLTIACCYPEVFHDESNLELISIQQAKDMLGNIDELNIYNKMIDWNWKESIVSAFEKLYLK